MNNFDNIDLELLKEVADLHEIPEGSYNIRKNGKLEGRKSTSEIEIISKEDKSGIDIIVKENTKNKSVHIPVIVSESGFNDVVYNDFYIKDNSDILIVAGCGIHNDSSKKSSHNGIHSFHIGKNCNVKYIEKHVGLGKKKVGKILNPQTFIHMEESSKFEMETMQLGGVTYSNRKTNAVLEENAMLLIQEKILTDNHEKAKTLFNVELVGKNSKVEVVSRSVAKGKSSQKFVSKVIGKNECFGHVECDGILLDDAQIESSPQVVAKNKDATLVHEAAIGKIAGEQIIKLQSLGLNEEEAQNEIIAGFLK